MKILLIEDDVDWVAMMAPQIEALGAHQLVVAENRDAAFERLGELTYDLIVCDLKIPADAHALDPDVAHGVAVLDRIEETAEGTRVVVLSGFGTLPVLQPYLARGAPADYFGTGTMWDMRDHVVKRDVDQFLDGLARFGEENAALERIEVNGAVALGLSAENVRILRSFACRHGGVTVDLRPLDGGRSSARTLAIEAKNQGDATCCRAVAKLDGLRAVYDEVARYFARIAPLLPLGTYTPFSGQVLVGAGGRGGVFYTLAEGYSSSLFDEIRSDPDRALGTIAILRQNLTSWYSNATAATVALRGLRLEQAPDDVLADPVLARLACADEERRDLHIHLGTSHGDLHGGNVLVNDDGQPVLIDFGRASQSSVVYDPVALELSMICHPDAQLGLGGWPSDEQWARWSEIDAFVEGCPIEPIVRDCRDWANGITRGEREVLGCAYAYLMRQLPYGHVPGPVIALAVGGVLKGLATR